MASKSELASSYPLAGKKVWVAGHRGMVGSALIRRLEGEDCELVTAGRERLDLTRQTETEEWMAERRPQAVFIAAARVGGIAANETWPVEFLHENLMIEANILHAAHRLGVEKVMLLGSSCIYPKYAPQPMTEDDLLGGPLEPTNEWYAVAKIAGIKLCQAYRRQHGCDFVSAMPTNLYGPGDNFELESSHVIPALIVKTHHAKVESAPEVEVWGSGRPRREFLYVDDAADALVHVMKVYSGGKQINIGAGIDMTIAELAQVVGEVVGFEGRWRFETSRPDGTPFKLLDSSALAALGWRPQTELREGLRQTYEWYLDALEANRLRA